MTRTVWLASYPKSGNTWFRMLLANLAERDSPVDINDLPERDGIASSRGPVDNLLLIESGLLTHDEVDCLRPRVYEELARGVTDGDDDTRAAEPAIRFIKAHDAYTLNPNGEPLLAGARGAAAAIVIVRDPRDIALSLAAHLNVGIDDAIVFMADRNAAFCDKADRQHLQLRQRLPGWSGHVASWLEQRDVPLHCLRYEDLQADTIGMLREALRFAGRPAREDDLRRAVAFADFAQLRRQEEAHGFREAPQVAPGSSFFRRGQAGAWRSELTADQVAQIETAHAPMMLRLGYAPVAGGLACAGMRAAG
jgi:hypothetical protein